MSTSQEPRSQELTQRASMYRLLAMLYRSEITPELGAKLNESGMMELLEKEGFDLESAALLDDEELVALSREYTRIFVGPGKHVAPYGSVHHPADPKRGSLWGDTTCRVQAFAKDHGLKFGGDRYDGIPDHIGHELEIYAKLLDGRAQAVEEGDDDRAQRILNSEQYLYREDLSRWIPLFCQQVQQVSRRPFYAELARLTSVLLEEEGARHGVADA